ncbi:YhgE/Pip domain-containing protein [Listeria weihenstephanensis]|uniref:YhgE/Pip domain-containing protein n=1 Tax=Listeria weihenstephanensis TaxID=1006155 RepID=A0A841Z9K0_9LIST|nr:YhgE/Pip domain-containing protein [Listeria weihenstephanensis]MBC1501272.1 YhgE/Pip domain-containing protein [Listeria weihenstephanensis]
MKKIWGIFILDWRRLFKAPIALVLVLALIILPSLYAWFNIEALWDPYSNTSGIKVAVVIQDEGAEINVPGKEPQKINVGAQLKDQLKKNDALGWTFTSEDKAKEGVKKGDYYAALFIPSDFSKDIVSFVGGNPTKPTINYTVNEKINAIAPKITDKGASTIVEQISTEFIDKVSKSVLSELNQAGVDLEKELPTIRHIKDKVFQVKQSMPQIIEMGKQAVLLEKKLPDLKQKANQVVELNKSMPQINAAAQDLLRIEDQLPQLDKLGKDILVLQQKIPEIKQIATDVKAIDANFGTIQKTVNDALGESTKALGIISEAEQALPTVKKIADDGSKYVNKVTDFSKQVDQSFQTVTPAIKQNLILLQQVTNNVYSLTEALKNGSIDPDKIVSVLDQIDEQLTSANSMLTKQIELLTSLNETLPNKPLTGFISDLKAMQQDLNAQQQTLAEIRQIVQDGKEPSQALLDQLNADAKKVSDDLTAVISQYDSKIVPTINAALKEITADLTKSSDLLEGAKDKLPEISSILKNANQTLTTSQTYLKEFQQRLPELKQTLDDATAFINTKLDTVISGINTAATFYQNDYPEVKAKIHKAGDFVRNDLPTLESEINNAAKLIQQKFPEFEKAVKLAANLSREELPQFEQAVNKAAARITEFDQNYDMQQIISFLRNDVEKDSDFIAHPIQLKETKDYPIPNYGSASAPFYTALCLWVGALLLVSLLRVDVEVPRGIFNHHHVYFGRLLTFLSIGLAQALIVTLGNIYLLGVYIASPLYHVLFSMLISLVFMTIVYTLVSLFNNVGKGIAIILLVLQISGAGGNFPIQVSPPFFQAIYPFLPFTYAVGLIRESVGGIYWPNATHDILMLVMFGLLFIALGLLLKKPLDKIVPGLSAKAKKSKLIH